MTAHGFGLGPDGHVDVDVVSDLVEGLLTDGEAASVEAHLAGCAECAEIRAALVEMRELLRTVDPVGPMPTAVADRIDQAIAQESRRRAGAAVAAAPVAAPPQTTSEPPAATVTSFEEARARRTRRRTGVLSAAAGIVAVAVGGIVAAVALSGNGGGTAVGGGATPQPPGALASRTVYTHSGTGYTVSGLAGQVQALLETDGLAPGSSSGPASLPGLLPSDIPGCVETGIQAKHETPSAVDEGTIEGRTAYVVVFPEANPKVVDAYVLDGTCSAGGAAPAGVLAKTRVTVS